MALASRLAVREVRRRPGRTLLVVLLVGVTVAGITLGDLSYRSRQLPMPVAFGQAVQKTSLQLVDEDARDAQERLTHGIWPGSTVEAGWEVYGLPVQRRDQLGWGTSVTMWTVDATAPLMRGAVVPSSGRLPVADDEVLLGERAAAALRVSVGDTLSLARPLIDLKVVGVGKAADGNADLMLTPGYPVDELRPSVRVAVQYSDFLRGPPSALWSTNDAEAAASLGVEYPPPPARTNYQELLLGWLGATLVLAVLGIVVAAAFAASGRRQLVTLGQLGAAGADERFARRFLALQGSITGLVGAVLGVGAGIGVVAVVGEPIIRGDRWNIAWADLVLVVLTAVVVATAAAVLPTRQLTQAPVLTALAGRAPVATVRPGQLRMGLLGIVFGLVVLGMSVAAASDVEGGQATGAIALALTSSFLILAGVCAMAPVIVDRWGRAGARAGGSTRLALRSLVRHRARSAALVAAIAAVGAMGVAGASGVERSRDEIVVPTQLDVVTIATNPFMSDVGAGGLDTPTPPTPPPIPAQWTTDVEGVLGPLSWTALHSVARDRTSGSFFVADDEALSALGVPRSMWPAIRATDTVTLQRAGLMIIDPAIEVPGLKLVTASLVTPEAAKATEWVGAGTTLIATTPAPLSETEQNALTVLASSTLYDYFFGAVGTPPFTQPFVSLGWEVEYAPSGISKAAQRWLVIAFLLLLVSLIVGIGLGLWAAEGKVERDLLVAVGAKPRSLAGMAGVRAWVLSVTGGLMAVPLGMITLRVVLHAIDRTSPMPWFTIVMLVVVLPLLVAGVSYVGSAAAQRLRPVTGTSMSLD